MAQQQGQKPDDFFAEQDLDRYTHDSVKGSADLDWSDENALLTQIVADAKCLLALATSSLPQVREAASLLEQLLLQDVEVKKTDNGEQAHIKEGTANGLFVKSDFDIDLDQDRVRCPAGKTTTTFSTSPTGVKTFTFGSSCAACPLRSACTTSRSGRSVSVHPQEARLREARAYQKTREGKARLRQRVVVEHRLARLGQLGIG